MAGSLHALLVLAACSVPVFGVHSTTNGINRMEFIRRKGTQLILDHRPFLIAGWNTYYLLDCTHLPVEKGLSQKGCPAADDILRKGSDTGLNVMRTWAFHDGKQQHKVPLQESPGVYNEATFQKLDYTIHRAREFGIRLILPLVDFVGAYGGALQYLKWSEPRRKFDMEDREKFWTCKKCKDLFKRHIAKILNRKNTYTNMTYKEDPVILAWELANEPRSPYTTNGNDLQNWIAEMSEFIKEIDPNHLVSIGSEGWFGKSIPGYQRANPPTAKYPIDWNATEGSDFIRNHDLPAVDLCTFRLWNHWLPDGTSEKTQKRFWKQWIDLHFEASEKYLNKPVILEEFGLRHVPLRTRDKFFKLAYKTIEQNVNRKGSAAGSLFWMLADDGYPDYDGFTVFHPAHRSTVSVIQEHSSLIRSYQRQGLANGNQMLRMDPIEAMTVLSGDNEDWIHPSLLSWLLEFGVAILFLCLPMLLAVGFLTALQVYEKAVLRGV